eukprot:CAMPEP_0184740066 /NCGR_PEP_ID=MMETSP0315-20130426/3045_1 /TAXON_ID=101924 /ORGANISM="Rhodosorus marinus, Strain UTEX LB 2760" /LENGTH=106 /DNA_ID=CAMNT_0027209461 /DNA_START=896 /DNA_END=1216 /DNA_ORIENTATION=+
MSSRAFMRMSRLGASAMRRSRLRDYPSRGARYLMSASSAKSAYSANTRFLTLSAESLPELKCIEQAAIGDRTSSSVSKARSSGLVDALLDGDGEEEDADKLKRRPA